MLYIARDKTTNGLKEVCIRLTEGEDRDSKTRGRIVVENDDFGVFYTSFEEFFDEWEVIGELEI